MEVKNNKAITDTDGLVKITGCDLFRRPGFSPYDRRLQQMELKTSSRPWTSNMEDEDKADELVVFGGMRARPQPRKLSTKKVEAHVIDYCPFRSWCRCCKMAGSRSDHDKRQAEDYNEVPVISRDHRFFHRHYTCIRDPRQEKQNDPCRLCPLQRN